MQSVKRLCSEVMSEERREKRLVRSLPQPTSAMTRIDLKTDPRVFAVLDDGCNRTCHTPAFIDHMRAVLESEGKELSPLIGEAKHFSGIGGCRATGRRSIPFGSALPDGSSVRAVLMSNELNIGTERIMLLSIKAQATLGLVKDTRAGTCFLKDYGQFAPLYEVVGSDLRCVCISDWGRLTGRTPNSCLVSTKVENLCRRRRQGSASHQNE